MTEEEYKFSLDKYLAELDKKSRAITNLGPQLTAITKELQMFDLLLIGMLNRTVNLNKAFILLINDNNFISAAPIVRISLDSLLRTYAGRVSEFDLNTFAKKVIGGTQINKINAYNSKQKLNDRYLVDTLSGTENMEWVSKIYAAGNSFVHFGDSIIFSSQKVVNDKEHIIIQSIGFNNGFTDLKEIHGAAFWLNQITDAIIQQVQIYMYEKCQQYDIDIEWLNDPEFVKSRNQK